MTQREFAETAQGLIQKYSATALPNRWVEAISFGDAKEVLAYWVRDSEEVVNLAWVKSDGIRDISLFPESQQAIFDFVPIRNVTQVEIREAPNIGRTFGYPVAGDFLVRLLTSLSAGGLAWVAETEQQVADLRAFSEVLLHKIAEASQSRL